MSQLTWKEETQSTGPFVKGDRTFALSVSTPPGVFALHLEAAGRQLKVCELPRGLNGGRKHPFQPCSISVELNIAKQLPKEMNLGNRAEDDECAN